MKIGPYEVLGELGRGGMGVVYRVRAPDAREAALKVLVKADAATLARFERERRLLSSLGEEEGFVGLLDSGISPEGAWLLMPLVMGGTLRQRLEAGPLGVEEALALGLRLATACGVAHQRGIVHRDVKPENVLFTTDGRALLADLGLAKHFDRGALGGSQSISLSAHGLFEGTVGYMAPEQVEDGRSVGPPADVFALGAVLYECLAGRPAFQGDTVVELLARVGSGVVAPIGRPGVPFPLERIVLRSLARDPRRRFADGGSLRRALLGLQESPRVVSKPGVGGRARRARLASLVVGACLGAAILAGIVMLLHGAKAQAPSSGKLGTSGQPPVTGRSEPRSPTLSAKDLDGRAVLRQQASDWEGAIAFETRAIELAPDFAVAWVNRGYARGRLGDWDGDIADETRAIALDPKIALAWGNRGQARAERGDYDGELADETKAIELDPRLSMAWNNRSVARGAKGDWDGEIADSSKAIELDPRNASAWDNHGAARAQKGDLDGAIADFTTAVELVPTLAQAWANRSAARGIKGDWEGVIADSTKAIELEPKRADVWLRRGFARHRLGRLDGAVADYERFLELAPADASAPKVRQWLAELEAKRGH